MTRASMRSTIVRAWPWRSGAGQNVQPVVGERAVTECGDGTAGLLDRLVQPPGELQDLDQQLGRRRVCIAVRAQHRDGGVRLAAGGVVAGG